MEPLHSKGEEIEKQLQEIQSEKKTINRELETSRSLEKNAEEQIRKFQALLEDKRSEESERTQKLSEWDVEMEKYRQQQEFKQQNVDRIEGEIKRFLGELAEINEELAHNEEEIRHKKENIIEIEKTIVSSHTTQGDVEEKLKTDVEKKEKLTGRQKNFFDVREELAKRMGDLDKEVYRLNAQRERLEGAMEAQINYMWDEYEITLSDAASLRDETFQDLTVIKRDIAEVKDQIKRLGDVNVNAIEDYKNLMERYSFLKNQHDDLVEAEQTLVGIINELDAAMRKQFSEKFREIAGEFDKVFKELFGGGKGTIELMEDTDILEAGIRIIAQPPGKKLQNMMQLSDGLA